LGEIMKLGKVYLVGAGPGDPGLLTLKARDLLAAADCVIYDYLINPEILNHAPPTAEKIFVGKHTGGFSWRQEDINRLLLDKARQCETIVRLKGGDPFVFGRGGEEALALVAAGIDWQVVPGVSAGASVAAYAGIPITHRGLGSSVTFVTGHEDPNKTHSALDWKSLANGADTLVFFMGVAKVGEIAGRLIKHGRRANTPVAVIRWGTYNLQQVWVSDLAGVRAMVQREKIASPALIVIGEVVRLRNQLQWFETRQAETRATAA
jgi:uroporphyrinogen III methyltransferase/synthase